MTNTTARKRWLLKHFSKTGIVSLVWGIFRTVLLIGLCFMILYPFAVKIIDSFKSFNDFLDPTVQYVPRYFTLDNVSNVFSQMNYPHAFFTTLWFSTLIALVQVMVSALVGYGFARFRFHGNKPLFFLVVMTLVVPPQTLIIPVFIRFRFFYGGVNLIGSFWPMIILAVTGLGIKNGLYIFLFRQYFKNMPRELEEASYIDGCSAFQTFWEIMLPTATALMATVFFLSFSWQWTDTVYSSLYLRGTGLLANTLSNVDGGEEEVMKTTYNNTAAVLSVLPIAFLYLWGQKFLTQSMERSGITG